MLGIGSATADHAGAIVPVVHSTLQEPEAIWRAFEAEAEGSPFHRYACVAAWLRHVGHHRGQKPLILTGRTDGGIAFLLPLVTDRIGPFRIARFLGDRHANHNTGLIASNAPALTDADRIAIVKALVDAAPGLDLLHLEGQPETVGGRPNPFLFDRSRPSGYSAWEIDLSDGFEGVLERHRGGKKRKRQRQQLKAFEAAGSVRFDYARTLEEAERVIEAFARQKAIRLAAQGVPDVFAEAGIIAFFKEMIIQDLDRTRAGFQAYFVEVAGEIRATFVTAADGERRFGLMNSIAVDDLSSHSPGDFLNFNLIAETAADGFSHFDFGIGDARYKRSWVDREYPLYETLLPLSASGAAAVAVLNARRRLRDAVVARPALYAAVQRLRRFGRKAEPVSSQDETGDGA